MVDFQLPMLGLQTPHAVSLSKIFFWGEDTDAQPTVADPSVERGGAQPQALGNLGDALAILDDHPDRISSIFGRVDFPGHD